MLRKYLFIAVAFAALCAWGIAPNWSDVSARSLNQSIPIDNPDGVDPTDPNEDIPEGGDNGVTGVPASDGVLSITVRPSAPKFKRGNLFSFIIRAVNNGRHNLRNVLFRFTVPLFTRFQLPAVQSAAVGDFTCGNGGAAGDICAYEVTADLAPGAAEEIDISLLVDANYPDIGVDPLTLYARVDGQNDVDKIFNTDRNSGTAVDEETDPTDETVPEESEDVEFSSPDDQDAPPATVDAENGIVSIPVGFENTSDLPLDNVLLSVQLPEGATVPDGSPWTCDESGLCVQDIGTVAPDESVNESIAFIDNNVSVGDTVTLPTRLDAQQTDEDGTVTPIALRGTVETAVEVPQSVDTPEMPASVDGRPISVVTADPDTDPSNLNATGITAEDVNDENLPEGTNGTKAIALDVDSTSPTFTRGEEFEFTGVIANTGQEQLTDAVARFVVPENTTLQSIENFTCQNGGVAGDVCAYAAGTIEPDTEATFVIPLMVAEDYPDNGIDPLSLSSRIDAKDLTADLFVAVRNSGNAVDIVPDIEDPSVPEVSEIVEPSSQDDGSVPSSTIDSESNAVSVFVGYENTSSVDLDNTVIFAQLPEGATIPDGSPWSCDENGTCIQNIGTVVAGESINAPFVFIGSNINVGDDVEVSTRFDAQQTAADGTVTPVSLRGTVAVTVEEAPAAPLALDETVEPIQGRMIFLPFVQN